MRAQVRGTARRRVVQAVAALAIVAQALVSAPQAPVSAAPAPVADGFTQKASYDNEFEPFFGTGGAPADLDEDVTSHDISADGRYVVFATLDRADRGCDFTAPFPEPVVTCTDRRDTNNVVDVFVRDTFFGTTELISNGQQARIGVLSCTPDSMTFADTGVGDQSSSQTETCTNLGPAAVTITSINDGTNFLTAEECSGQTLGVGDQCSFGIFFRPTAAGTHNETITISDNNPNTDETVAVSGTAFNYAVASLDCLPDSADMGFIEIPGSSTATITCTATAPPSSTAVPARVTITDIDIEGSPPFSTPGGTCFSSLVLTITPPATSTSCTRTVAFTPTTGGTDFTGALRIEHNGSNGPACPVGETPGPQCQITTLTGDACDVCVSFRGPTANLDFGQFDVLFDTLRSGSPRLSGKIEPQEEEYIPRRISGPRGALMPMAVPTQAPPAVEPSTCDDLVTFECVAVGGDRPTISDDGRYIVFQHQNGSTFDIFIADRGAPDQFGTFPTTDPNVPGGRALVISKISFFYDSEAGEYIGDPDDLNTLPAISGDGSQVAWVLRGCSDCPTRVVVANLDSNGDGVRDDLTTTVLRGVPSGDDPNGFAEPAFPLSPPAISADGEHVAWPQFVDLTPTAGFFPAIVVHAYDRDLDGDGLVGDRDVDGDGEADVPDELRIVPVSQSADPTQPDLYNTVSLDPSLSGDGSVVTYSYGGECLDCAVTVAEFDGFDQVTVTRRDPDTGLPARSVFASVTDAGVLGDDDSFDPAVSDNGRYVAFSTFAPNILQDPCDPYDTSCDATPPAQIISVDLGPPGAAYPAINDGPVRVSTGFEQISFIEGCTGPETLGDDDSFGAVLTATGSEVGFLSMASNLLGYQADGDACEPVDRNLGNNDNRFGTDSFLRTFNPDNSIRRGDLVACPEAPPVEDAVAAPCLFFPAQRVGTTSLPRSVHVFNEGFGPIVIPNGTEIFIESEIAGDDPQDFAVQADGCTTGTADSPVLLAGTGDVCTVSIVFRPTGLSERTATVRIGFNDDEGSAAADGPSAEFFEEVVFRVSGIGVRQPSIPPKVPTMSVAPDSLAFPTANIGEQTPSQSVTLTASGNADIHVGGLTFEGANPGDFVITGGTCGTPPFTIVTGTSCTIEVAAKTTKDGVRNAILRISSDATGGPHLVRLQANSPSPKLLVNPGVARRGTTAQIIGTDWPVNAPLTIEFEGGGIRLITDPVTTNGEGAFVADILLLPKQQAVPREITVTAPNDITARTNLLIVQGSVQGGNDFLYRD